MLSILAATNSEAFLYCSLLSTLDGFVFLDLSVSTSTSCSEEATPLASVTSLVNSSPKTL